MLFGSRNEMSSPGHTAPPVLAPICAARTSPARSRLSPAPLPLAVVVCYNLGFCKQLVPGHPLNNYISCRPKAAFSQSNHTKNRASKLPGDKPITKRCY